MATVNHAARLPHPGRAGDGADVGRAGQRATGEGRALVAWATAVVPPPPPASPRRPPACDGIRAAAPLRAGVAPARRGVGEGKTPGRGARPVTALEGGEGSGRPRPCRTVGAREGAARPHRRPTGLPRRLPRPAGGAGTAAAGSGRAGPGGAGGGRVGGERGPAAARGEARPSRPGFPRRPRCGEAPGGLRGCGRPPSHAGGAVWCVRGEAGDGGPPPHLPTPNK